MKDPLNQLQTKKATSFKRTEELFKVGDKVTVLWDVLEETAFNEKKYDAIIAEVLGGSYLLKITDKKWKSHFLVKVPAYAVIGRSK